MAKPGRPRAYSDEAAEEICHRIAEGESLLRICEDAHLPARSTVSLWVVNNEGGFSDKYTRARQAQAVMLADQLIGISDREDPEAVQRDRLRVDTRKWYLSKVLPKVYGEKLEIAVTEAPTLHVILAGPAGATESP